MITTRITLRVGDKDHTRNEWYDEPESFDFVINLYEGAINLLEGCIGSMQTYAELVLHVTGSDIEYCLASFKRIKLKNKGYRWVVDAVG